MKKRFFIVPVSSICALASAVIAARPIPDKVSVEAIDPVSGVAVAAAGLNYSTGFEPGEGFVLGYISNSGGAPAGCGGAAFPCWGHTSGAGFSLLTPTIESLHPASGLQHLRITHDPTTRTNITGFGLGVDARYPRTADLSARPVAPNTVSVDIAISAPGGQDFRVQPQSNSQGLPATAVLFFYTGAIYVWDDYCGSTGLGFFPVGVNWDTTGAYHNLTIAMDPCQTNFNYYYAGQLVHTACTFAGTNLEQLLIFGDNYEGSEIDIDNVVLQSDDLCLISNPRQNCCDTNGPDQGCTFGVFESECQGPDKIWDHDCGIYSSNRCRCIPLCSGRLCGDDGCGGSCGNCDDGDVCNGIETCNGIGSCIQGTPLNCDDGDACVVFETCDPVAGCVPGIPLPCDDGLFCDGEEFCVPIYGCQAGNSPCTENETCDEESDQCVPNSIPTVSQWGLVVLTLLLLAAAKVRFGRRAALR